MSRSGLFSAACLGLLLAMASQRRAGSAPAEAPEDVRDTIRRFAGLPSAPRSDVEVVDVGAHPLDTMISLSATKRPAGWRVTYACAGSPKCAPGDDHAFREYPLSENAALELNALLERLRRAPDLYGTSPVGALCGRFVAHIRYGSSERTLRAPCEGEADLGRLEALLLPPDH